MLVLAHSDTAYARSGLVGEIIQGSAWPDDAWQTALAQGVDRARTHGTRQLVVLLPYRASPVLWTQWALMMFAQMGARLDNTADSRRTGRLGNLRCIEPTHCVG